MNKRELVFALKFQTTNQAAMAKAAKEINKAAAAAKKLEKEGKQAASAMTRLGLKARAAGKSMVRLSREARSAFSRMRTGALRLGAALGAIGFAVGLTEAINVAKEFEFQMARLSAISGQLGKETQEQFRALESVARRLGGTTPFTAGQVSNGLRLLAQAGFSAQEAIASIPGTLNLAIAATTDLGTATTITANTIRGFNLEASEASRVADILTATTQGSNTTIEALGEALKFVAPAARAANQDIETVSAALGTLSDAGLKGTLAGTGLRRVLVGLLNPTKAARNAFGRLGLNVKDLDPRLRSLDEIFQDLNKNGFGASEAFEAFGLRGGPAALVLSNLLSNFRELNEEVSKSEGIAQAFADRINDTLRGSILRLKSAFQEFIISQGALAKAFRKGIDNIRLFFEALNGTLNPLEEGAAGAADWAAALKRLIPVMKIVIGLMITMTVLITLMSGGMNLLLGLLGTAVLGLGALAWAFGTSSGEADQLNRTLQGTEDILARIAVTEAARAKAQAAVDADPTNREAIDELNRTRGNDLAILGDVQAAALAAERLIQHNQNQIAENLLRQKELNDQRLIIFDTDFGLAFGDRNELKDLQAKRLLLADEIDQLREKGELLEAPVQLRKDELEAIDAANRANKEANSKAIADANEINQILNSLSSTRKNQIDDLADNLKVLKAELAGGAGGKLAADIEKILQAGGYSGTKFDEQQIQGASLIERITTQLATARENLAKAKLGTDQEIIASAEKVLKAEQDNLTQANKVVAAATRQEAAARSLAEQSRKTQADIAKGTADRAAAAAAIKKQEAAERSFQRFRITQIAKLNEEIILQQTVTTERKKAAAGIKLINRATAAGVVINKEWIDALFVTIDKLDEASASSDSFFEGFAQGAKDYIDEAATFAEQGAELFKNTFQSLEDELVAFVETGKFSFRELGETIRSTLLRQGVRNIMKSALSHIPGLEGAGGTAEEAVAAQLLAIEQNLSQTAVERTQADTQIHLLEAINQSIINLSTGATSSTVLPATGGAGRAGTGFVDVAVNGIIGGLNSVGGLGGIVNAFAERGGIPRFAKGGVTDSKARKAMGIGQSEIPAILHPNEAVIPLTREGRIPLDIVNGLPEVRLPGSGRSIGTSTQGPADLRTATGLIQAGMGTEGITGSTQQNALAFFGAPRFQTGTDGFFSGIDFGSIFSSVGTGLVSALTFLPNLIGDAFANFDFDNLLSNVGSIFGGDNDIFGGLFGGDGALSGINNFFTGDGAGTIAGGLTALADSPIGQDFGDTFDKIKSGVGSVGKFLGIGGESATNVAGLASDTTDTTAVSFGTAGFAEAADEISGLGKVTKGAQDFLADIPGVGALFRENKEGKTPFGNLAKGVLPIGLALALGQFTGGGGGGGKSSFKSTGRVLGFNEKEDEDSLTKEEKELLKQLNAGRRALGGGKSGLKSGNIPAFGTGGVVSGPTLALVGERTPEAIVPLSNGAIPVRVSGGQQTGKVITNNVNFQIVTPDADSFREAQSQIQASTAASIGRAAQRQD